MENAQIIPTRKCNVHSSRLLVSSKTEEVRGQGRARTEPGRCGRSVPWGWGCSVSGPEAAWRSGHLTAAALAWWEPPETTTAVRWWSTKQQQSDEVPNNSSQMMKYLTTTVRWWSTQQQQSDDEVPNNNSQMMKYPTTAVRWWKYSTAIRWST